MEPNKWHGNDPLSHGETDLYVTLGWAGGATVHLLIENKVGASLQPTQAERYLARAAELGGAAVLIAPQRWLDRQKDAVRRFHHAHALEDLADWLRTHSDAEAVRLAWRAAMLEELAKPRALGTVLDHKLTIAFRDHCVAWLKEHGSTAEASLLSLHTENQGWLWFRHPRDLYFKARNGTVDLYVGVNGFAGTVANLGARLATRPAPAGFSVTTDTSQKRNVVLRHEVQAFLPEEGVPADPPALDLALDACLRITEWFDQGGANLLRGEAPTS